MISYGKETATWNFIIRLYCSILYSWKGFHNIFLYYKLLCLSKAAFVSVVKEIKKTFYTLEGVWVRKKNWVKRKIISIGRKICPLTL